jgi:competence protein ComK
MGKMNNYIINNDTLLIIGKNTYCIIYESNKKLISNKLSTDIIKESCMYYGSSFKGRVEGTKNLIGVSYKCPIIVSDNIIMFPTASNRDNSCSWINYNNVDNYYVTNNLWTKIIFKNGIEILLDLSIGIFDKQYLRSSRLINVLNGRKK